jgi:hypothetical protein
MKNRAESLHNHLPVIPGFTRNPEGIEHTGIIHKDAYNKTFENLPYPLFAKEGNIPRRNSKRPQKGGIWRGSLL